MEAEESVVVTTMRPILQLAEYKPEDGGSGPQAEGQEAQRLEDPKTHQVDYRAVAI